MDTIPLIIAFAAGAAITIAFTAIGIPPAVIALAVSFGICTSMMLVHV